MRDGGVKPNDSVIGWRFSSKALKAMAPCRLYHGFDCGRSALATTANAVVGRPRLFSHINGLLSNDEQGFHVCRVKSHTFSSAT